MCGCSNKRINNPSLPAFCETHEAVECYAIRTPCGDILHLQNGALMIYDIEGLGIPEINYQVTNFANRDGARYSQRRFSEREIIVTLSYCNCGFCSFAKTGRELVRAFLETSGMCCGSENKDCGWLKNIFTCECYYPFTYPKPKTHQLMINHCGNIYEIDVKLTKIKQVETNRNEKRNGVYCQKVELTFVAEYPFFRTGNRQCLQLEPTCLSDRYCGYLPDCKFFYGEGEQFEYEIPIDYVGNWYGDWQLTVINAWYPRITLPNGYEIYHPYRLNNSGITLSTFGDLLPDYGWTRRFKYNKLSGKDLSISLPEDFCGDNGIRLKPNCKNVIKVTGRNYNECRTKILLSYENSYAGLLVA